MTPKQILPKQILQRVLLYYLLRREVAVIKYTNGRERLVKLVHSLRLVLIRLLLPETTVQWLVRLHQAGS